MDVELTNGLREAGYGVWQALASAQRDRDIGPSGTAQGPWVDWPILWRAVARIGDVVAWYPW